MSNRFEFPAEIEEGRITVPQEIVSRLHAKGILRLHVVVAPAQEAEDELLQRGIDSETIDRVAAAQRYAREIAFNVLAGEGAAAGTGLVDRLEDLDSLRGNRP